MMEFPNANDYPQFLHHGAAGGVTGSCHRYLASSDAHLLIDCGLFQGQDVTASSHHAQHRIEFDIGAIQALVATHVHIDHIGRLPYLVAAGFKRPIICSEPSARLLPLVIEDALKVGFTKDKALITIRVR
jgi:metallo-beta-lactamase family protein